MKIKLLIAFCLMLNIGFARAATTCRFDKTSISITEDKGSYEMVAEFDEAKTKKVMGVMDDYLKPSASFKNTQIDAVMTLDDHTTFYVKTGPGKLTLKLDKRKNSAEVYQRFKKMVEKIKEALGEK